MNWYWLAVAIVAIAAVVWRLSSKLPVARPVAQGTEPQEAELRRRVAELEKRALAYSLYVLCAEKGVAESLRDRLRERYGTELARPQLRLDSSFDEVHLSGLVPVVRELVSARGVAWAESRLPLTQLEDAVLQDAGRQATGILATEQRGE